MKKLVLAAILVTAFAVPASAKPHYVMYNKATGTCSISKTAPTESEKFSMMGIYGSAYMARRAMHGMMKCR
ncbi:MAG: hypothetical protein AB7V40_05990 [Methyloceanibacter sp.]